MKKNLNKIKRFSVDQAIQAGLLSGQTDYQRFIFLSTHRSGSSYLANLVKSHPDTQTYSEVFLPRKIIWGSKVYRTKLRIDKLYKKRNSDPVRFLNEDIFRPYSSDIKAVGFKILYDQLDHFDKLKASLYNDQGLKVIHLKRLNQLDRLISRKKANVSGVMNLRNDSLIKKNNAYQFELTVDECRTFFKESEKKMAQYEKLFSGNVLTITYSELVDKTAETLQKIQGFLGLNHEVLHSPLIKQNSIPQSTMIKNYSSLKQQFENSEWARFFKD